MESARPKRAHLISEIPPDRYTIERPHGRAPVIGDVLELDQGYTGQDGLPTVLAYCKGDDGIYVYGAEVYESELGPSLDPEP